MRVRGVRWSLRTMPIPPQHYARRPTRIRLLRSLACFARPSFAVTPVMAQGITELAERFALRLPVLVGVNLQGDGQP